MSIGKIKLFKTYNQPKTEYGQCSKLEKQLIKITGQMLVK